MPRDLYINLFLFSETPSFLNLKKLFQHFLKISGVFRFLEKCIFILFNDFHFKGLN